MTFEELLKKCSATAYAEPESFLHTELVNKILPEFEQTLPRKCEVLDVGCGPGHSARLFREAGHKVCAISILADEVEKMKQDGFEAHQLDMHSIGILGQRFDAVWARHVLEHSPAPLLVLIQLCEVLRPGGSIYMEVPAPETDSHHETNPNHWTLLTANGWAQLIGRAGFTEAKGRFAIFKLEMGKEVYFQYVAKKPALLPGKAG